jgi:hypothetical protein
VIHGPTWAVRAEKYRFKPSLANAGMQPGASGRPRSWTTVWAAAWMRAPGTLWVMQQRKKLADRVKNDPEPQRVRSATQPRAQVVQLQVREV